MLNVEESIRQLETLYTSITGREPPPPNGAYAAIPPERDPAAFVEESMDRLARMLDDRTVASAFQPQRPLKVDVWENDVECIVLADLPGIDRQQVAVTASGQMLTIVADRAVRPPSGTVPRHSERRSGRYLRHVVLGPSARTDEATARLAGGVLDIRVPKGAPGKPVQRTVEVA